MDPCDYLVEDCWRHLFKFLPAEDKQALCDTCETFHAMLQPQKLEWGIELILPHITKYIHPYIDPKRQISFYLKCRQVCKSWRVTIDKVCRSIPSSWRHPSIREKYNFERISILENFLAFFKAHQGNPFIGRRVSINAMSIGADKQGEQEDLENEEPEVDNEENEASEKIEMDEPGNGNEEDEDHEEDDAPDEVEGEDRRAQEVEKMERIVRNRQLVLELLAKFGKEIDDLAMDLMDNCSLLEAYKCLQIVLNNCLNLKSLEFFISDYEEETRKEQDDALPKALAEYFERNQLPKMDRLQDLILSDMDVRLEKLVLETYGQNLQRLQRYGTSDIPVAIWSNMKCLRNLSLFVSSNEQAVKLLQAIDSPLETLTVEICTPLEGTHTHAGSQKLLVFKMDKFLLAIQHLPLKEVSIEPESGTQFNEEAPFPADFPKHQTILKFSIRYCRVYSPNFLQFLPNLQTFVVNSTKCLMKFNPSK